MLSEISLAMFAGIPLRKLAGLIHPYPTYSLGIRRAADKWLSQTILSLFTGSVYESIMVPTPKQTPKLAFRRRESSADRRSQKGLYCINTTPFCDRRSPGLWRRLKANFGVCLGVLGILCISAQGIMLFLIVRSSNIRCMAIFRRRSPQAMGSREFEIWRASIAVGSKTPKHSHETEEVLFCSRGRF